MGGIAPKARSFDVNAPKKYRNVISQTERNCAIVSFLPTQVQKEGALKRYLCKPEKENYGETDSCTDV